MDEHRSALEAPFGLGRLLRGEPGGLELVEPGAALRLKTEIEFLRGVRGPEDG